jgi:hypothetical protein
MEKHFSGSEILSKWTMLRVQGLWTLRCCDVFLTVHVRVNSVIAYESSVGSGFGCTAKRHDMKMIKKMGVVTGVGGHINIGRNALDPIEKGKCCDRSNAGIGVRSSKRRQTQIGACAIQSADGLSLFRAERYAATRFADMFCEPLRAAKDMPVARSVGVRQEVAQRAGLNLCVGKIQRLRVRRRFAFAHTLPSAELCEGRTQNFAPLGDAPHFAIGPLAIHATREFGLGRKICPPNKNPAATFHAPAVEQLKNSPSADAILSRLRSPANPNTAFSAIHGTFHTQNLESTGINHEALCGISRCCNAKRKEHLTNVVRQVRVSRVVKYMFQRQRSVRHESKDGRESFMCFGPESSRDARDGFAETWRRGTDVYRGLRRLRQRVKARVLDIAQEVGHGQRGFAKRAVVVEHPSGQHCFGGFFEPLVDQNSNFSPQIRRVIEAGQFKRLQGSS